MKRIISYAVFFVLLTVIAGCQNKNSIEGDKKGTFTDKRDNTEYKWVSIGDQVWMAENLAFKPTKGKYWAYENDQRNVADYGYLYDWETALSACPLGWHLPTDEEWKTLEMHLGMSQAQADFAGNRRTDEGGKLKEKGTTHWVSPNIGATNESGFTALPGGHRNSNGFYAIGTSGQWWSATEYKTDLAWYRDMDSNYSHVYRDFREKEMGYSVRCIRDND